MKLHNDTQQILLTNSFTYSCRPSLQPIYCRLVYITIRYILCWITETLNCVHPLCFPMKECMVYSWKRVVTPGNGEPFGDYSYLYLFVGFRRRQVGRIYVFLYIICTILFNVYFGKLVMTFIDIGEIGCMSIPECHWMVIVVNMVKQTWLLHDAACCAVCVCRVSIGHSCF